MSAKELDKLNLALLKEVQEVLARDFREDLNDTTGQLFVFSFADFEKYLTNKLQVEFKVNKTEADKLAKEAKDDFLKRLKNTSTSGIKPGRLRALKSKKKALETGGVPGAQYAKIKPETHKVYIVENYGIVKGIKYRVGKAFETKTGIRKGVITGAQKEGSSEEDLEGIQLGHGEFGVAVSGSKLLAAERLLSTLSNQGLTEIKQTLATSKSGLETTSLLKASQVIDSDGNFKKSFIPFISSQLTTDNQKDQKIEQEAITKFTAAVNKKVKELDILNQKGSDSIKEAVTATTKYNFAKQKRLKVSGPTKPKKVSKSKGRSKQKTASKIRGKTAIAVGAGAPDTKPKRRGQSTAQGLQGPQLLGIFNRDLSRVLQQNMINPRLNYRTGRFADSVKVVDVNTTAKGYPSFGYTYDKFPYQTFEPGYRQGSQQRDPRKLIDASMRQIAAQYALGRFFTRRL